ncbi:MAG: glycosyl hydrolase [Actinomycetota bacterium]
MGDGGKIAAGWARLAVAAALGTVVATGCGSDQRPSGDTLGYRAGGGLFDAEQFLAAESWLDTDIRYTVQFAGRQSQRDMNGSVFGLVADEDATLDDLADDVTLSLTVPLAFGQARAKTIEGREEIAANLLAVAEGEFDEAYERVAARLVDAGHGDAVLRLGHEFNGTWAPWSSRTNESAFIAAWRRVHDVMTSVSPDFRFDWTALRPAWQEWGVQAYPGDDYVDVIGLDVYWRVSPNQDPWDPSVWDRRYLRVMRDHQAFAVSRGKQVSYPEWGLTGADVPQYIEAMHEWLSELPASGPGSLMYHAYFDDNREFDFEQYPRARETYLELFGG